MQPNGVINCMILAAGKSSRFGSDKLKYGFGENGESILQTVAKKIANPVLQNLLQEIVIVTRPDLVRFAEEATSNLTKQIRVIENPGFEFGMMTSIQTGIQNFKRPASGLMIVLADQPNIEVATILKIASHFSAKTKSEANTDTKANTDTSVTANESSGAIVAPIYNGKRGHPVIFSYSYSAEILQQSSKDVGCAFLFKKYPEVVELIEVSDKGILHDIDTLADLAT